MTAQIGIMNKRAIVLATDSAVTVSSQDGKKIFNSVNKVFSLSKTKPVALMVYGGADLLGIPWETIVKMYRSKNKKKSFKTLKEYAVHFMSWIANPVNSIFSKADQIEYIKDRIGTYFSHYINNPIDEEVKELIKKGTPNPQLEAIKLLDNKIDSIYSVLLPINFIEGMNVIGEARFFSNHKTLIEELSKLYFPSITNKAKIDKIHTIAGHLMTKDCTCILNNSGIVIAGFGDDDMFPALIEFKNADGVFDGRIRYSTEEIIKIENNVRHSYIMPFAQDDIIKNFLYGIHPDNLDYFQKSMKNYPDFVRSTIDTMKLPVTDIQKNNLVGELERKSTEIFTTFCDQLRNIFSQPISRMVESMPIVEMSELAESLINLTSLKKKVTMTTESVGGETEVLSITKGEGLIWIKRKHYFDPKFNPGFVNHYLDI